MQQGISIEKSDSTWLNVGSAIFGALVALVTAKSFEMFGVQFGWAERYDQWYPIAQNISTVVMGILGVVWLRINKERNEYLLASVNELRKVSWPSMVDTRRMTTVVFVVVGIFAIILGIFDVVWASVLRMLY